MVQAAFDAIASHGLEKLRLRPVAASAGIDHSTLHHYFSTKQDLVIAVVELATAPLRSTMPIHGTMRERLDEHLAKLASMMRSDPDLFVVLAEIDLRARRDPDVAAAVASVEAGWRAALGMVFRTIEPDSGSGVMTELTIATVKGTRLDPARGSAVLETLRVLLTRVPVDNTELLHQ